MLFFSVRTQRGKNRQAAFLATTSAMLGNWDGNTRAEEQVFDLASQNKKAAKKIPRWQHWLEPRLVGLVGALFGHAGLAWPGVETMGNAKTTRRRKAGCDRKRFVAFMLARIFRAGTLGMVTLVNHLYQSKFNDDKNNLCFIVCLNN